MEHCPHCNQKLLFGENPLIHTIRKISGSHKRFCPECGRKWVGRSRQRNSGGVFVFVLLTGITGMFGLFQISGSLPTSFAQMKQDITTSVYKHALQSMAESAVGESASNVLNKSDAGKLMGRAASGSLSGGSNARLMARIEKFKNNPALQAKIRRLQNDPKAMARFQKMGGMNALANMTPEMLENAARKLERQ